MSLIGYARVSTVEQDPSGQLGALQAAGCERVFVDHASGALDSRPELAAALDYVRPGDTLVVWRLDRLGRSLPHLLLVLTRLLDQGVAFRSLQEAVDTATPAGRMLASVLGAFAEFERSLIRERTLAGLAAARASGVRVGRPPALTRDQVGVVQVAAESGSAIASLARAHGVSRSTIYRAVARQRKS